MLTAGDKKASSGVAYSQPVIKNYSKIRRQLVHALDFANASIGCPSVPAHVVSETRVERRHHLEQPIRHRVIAFAMLAYPMVHQKNILRFG